MADEIPQILYNTHGRRRGARARNAGRRPLAPIPADEMCLCIDESCPECGWPERITPLPGAGAGEVFGCRRCNYVSRKRTS